ncbi:MAG: hypothetical protein AAF639_15145 [Chloroflexota bacterium]
MRLSFIGMSGVGKSHWSGQLEAAGFRRFACDVLIAERLGLAIERQNHSRDAQVDAKFDAKFNVGAWMGLPYESHYRGREAQYLAHETAVMTEILAELAQNPQDTTQNIIVDTTGSVIYTSPVLLERLSQLTTIVYLDAPDFVQERMYQSYIANPAPVLWRDHFRPQQGECREDALACGYRELLAARTEQYRALAHVTLDYHILRQEGFGLAEFLAQVQQTTVTG